MKKLVLVFACVAASVIANAASFNWQVSGLKDADGADPFTGTATLFAYVKTDTTKTPVYSTTGDITSGAINVVVSSDSLVAGTTYSFYYTINDPKGAFTSTIKSTKANATTTQTLNFGSGGEWSAVPEPTSALLMVLGVAGLALRRKRV